MTEFLNLIESWRRREAMEDVVVEVPEAGMGALWVHMSCAT